MPITDVIMFRKQRHHTLEQFLDALPWTKELAKRFASHDYVDIGPNFQDLSYFQEAAVKVAHLGLADNVDQAKVKIVKCLLFKEGAITEHALKKQTFDFDESDIDAAISTAMGITPQGEWSPSIEAVKYAIWFFSTTPATWFIDGYILEPDDAFLVGRYLTTSKCVSGQRTDSADLLRFGKAFKFSDRIAISYLDAQSRYPDAPSDLKNIVIRMASICRPSVGEVAKRYEYDHPIGGAFAHGCTWFISAMLDHSTFSPEHSDDVIEQLLVQDGGEPTLMSTLLETNDHHLTSKAISALKNAIEYSPCRAEKLLKIVDRDGATILHRLCDMNTVNGNADTIKESVRHRTALVAQLCRIVPGLAGVPDGWLSLPIHQAAHWLGGEAIAALHEAHPEGLDARDMHGWTPFLEASQWMNRDAMKTLHSLGADITVQLQYNDKKIGPVEIFMLLGQSL